MEFTYNSSTPTQGILWYLYNAKDGIPYSNAVFAKSSSQCDNNYHAENVIDFNDDKYWIAAVNAPIGEYITIISLYKIKLKGYLIKTSNGGIGACHPRFWSFAISKDGIHYKENISFSDTTGQMNSNLRYQYVPYVSQKVRFFRIYVNGLSYCNAYRFDLNQVELFGTLYKGNAFFNDCSCKTRNSKYIEFFVNILVLCLD